LPILIEDRIESVDRREITLPGDANPIGTRTLEKNPAKGKLFQFEFGQ
jgi:hypothetical protein